MALLFLAACSGVEEPSGDNEPIIITGAKFVPGTLPGSPPSASSSSDAGAGAQVLDIEVNSSLLKQGAVNEPFSGHTTTDAYSIGVRLQGEGSGYWILPVQGPDPTQDGDLTFNFQVNVSFTAPVGNINVLFVAFDSKGNAGTQQALPVCVGSYLPDNLNSCDSSLKPPAAIVSLSWDTNADLDIVLVTPTGKTVDAKHPTTAPVMGSSVPTQFLPPADPTTGYIDQDSNAACVEDNQRREDVVWEAAPPTGTYDVYVNEFADCSATASTFKVTTYLRQTGADGGSYSLAQTNQIAGQLLGSQANGGSGSPLYVTSISFP